MTRIATILVLIAATCAGIGACASNDPGVSGVPIFNRRVFFVGDDVTISLPADERAGDVWKLVSFDSSVLRPQAGSGERTDGRITFKFTAARPGESNLTFQRIRNGRSLDERRTYKVIVRDRL